MKFFSRRRDVFIDQPIWSILDLIVYENFMMFIANLLCEVLCTAVYNSRKYKKMWITVYKIY